ncbi:hypothetical protein D8674_026377 [Pyrus ussuriensis x Pyrus communis]|uniref:DUF4283 domain-containing protein n=1 Tax=Pyrus ussuriensis x Pyrus communis TaxID=2448454 RepID=A0A5N5I9R9_9ROSA|nr:hypothetical protein D8674_026377 [Pyrus ussuriensis x Pyrus communis]
MGEPVLAGDMEELGVKLGSNLKLSKKERKVIVMGRKEAEEALIGFHFCPVVEVFTTKEVHRDVFIDIFTSLWRGKSGVLIRDLGGRRFLACFVTEQDLIRVIEADHPWTFKDDLVMVENRTHAELHGNSLHLGSRKGAGSGDGRGRRSSRRQQQRKARERELSIRSNWTGGNCGAGGRIYGLD